MQTLVPLILIPGLAAAGAFAMGNGSVELGDTRIESTCASGLCNEQYFFYCHAESGLSALDACKPFELGCEALRLDGHVPTYGCDNHKDKQYIKAWCTLKRGCWSYSYNSKVILGLAGTTPGYLAYQQMVPGTCNQPHTGFCPLETIDIDIPPSLAPPSLLSALLSGSPSLAANLTVA